jgi:hypothetical protein
MGQVNNLERSCSLAGMYGVLWNGAQRKQLGI